MVYAFKINNKKLPQSFYFVEFSCKNLADGEGFEPPIPFGIPDFESGAFNRTLPPIPHLHIADLERFSESFKGMLHA